MNQESEFLKVREASRLARTSEFTIRRWVRDGLLPATRVTEHGPYLIRHADLRRILGGEA